MPFTALLYEILWRGSPVMGLEISMATDRLEGHPDYFAPLNLVLCVGEIPPHIIMAPAIFLP